MKIYHLSQLCADYPFTIYSGRVRFRKVGWREATIHTTQHTTAGCKGKAMKCRWFIANVLQFYSSICGLPIFFALWISIRLPRSQGLQGFQHGGGSEYKFWLCFAFAQFGLSDELPNRTRRAWARGPVDSQAFAPSLLSVKKARQSFKYSCTDQAGYLLVGHMFVLQLLPSIAFPTHGFPPYCGLGLSHVRILCRLPPSHVLLQEFHGSHDDHPPFIAFGFPGKMKEDRGRTFVYKVENSINGSCTKGKRRTEALADRVDKCMADHLGNIPCCTPWGVKLVWWWSVTFHLHNRCMSWVSVDLNLTSRVFSVYTDFLPSSNQTNAIAWYD